MSSLFRVMLYNMHSCKVIFQMGKEERLDPLVKLRLISFDGQTVVRSFVDDLGSNFGLASHRIDRDQTTGNLDDLEQFWDCRDFIALLVGNRFAQTEVIGRCLIAHHMNGGFPTRVVIASAQRLAINGDDLSVCDLVQFGKPRQQNRFKFFWLDCVQDRIESIVRGNAMSHIQKLGKPVLLRVGESCDCNEDICSCDHSTDHHEQYVDQWMNGFTWTRVGYVAKLIDQ